MTERMFSYQKKVQMLGTSLSLTVDLRYIKLDTYDVNLLAWVTLIGVVVDYRTPTEIRVIYKGIRSARHSGQLR